MVLRLSAFCGPETEGEGFLTIRYRQPLFPRQGLSMICRGLRGQSMPMVLDLFTIRLMTPPLMEDLFPKRDETSQSMQDLDTPK